LEEATEAARQALDLCRRLFTKEHYPDGHPDLATSLNNLGAVLRSRGDYARAEPLHRDALAMHRQLYPPGRSLDRPPPPPAPPRRPARRPTWAYRRGGGASPRGPRRRPARPWPCAGSSSRRNATPRATPTWPRA